MLDDVQPRGHTTGRNSKDAKMKQTRCDVAGTYLVVFAPVHVGAASDSSTVHDVGRLHPLNVRQDLLAVLEAGSTVLILGSLQHVWCELRALWTLQRRQTTAKSLRVHP